jgi:hypothetical protein
LDCRRDNDAAGSELDLYCKPLVRTMKSKIF